MSSEINQVKEDIKDLRAASITDKKALIHTVQANFETIFTWQYEPEHLSLDKLYKKATLGQWNGDLDIDWTVGGQIDRARSNTDSLIALSLSNESVFTRMNAKERADFGHASIAWTISQFLHTEQGALMAAAKLVQAVPWADAKYYAATQVIDEARHMEVFARYLNEKLEWQFPVNEQLKSLLELIISPPEWDFTYLGMQVFVEGLALASFAFQYALTKDPLLKQISRYLIADEARHVAFGMLSLREVYAEMSSSELRKRQEFCYECAIRLCDRFLAKELWEALGLPAKKCMDAMKNDPSHLEFRKALFSKIVPNVKRLGLLDQGDGWLRRRFAELGVLQYENVNDNGIEDYQRMDLDHAPWSVIQYKHY